MEETPSEPAPPAEAPAEPVAEPVAEPPPPAPPASRRGRPAGAKDKEPRKKKIVVQPLAPPEPPPPAEPAQPAEPEPVPEMAPEIEAPPSPRSLLRETSRHLVHLKSIVNDNRRSTVASTYTQKLCSWPV